LGSLSGALLLLCFFSVVDIFVAFRPTRKENASHYIVIAYGVLAGICTLMWWMSAVELFRHYSGVPLSGLVDKILAEAMVNRSSEFLLIDVIGLSVGFLCFIASQQTMLNTIISFFLAIIVSPATVFCFDRLLAELRIIAQIQKTKRD
jgi:hypothetical protein